jgi:hypothetical protein
MRRQLRRRTGVALIVRIVSAGIAMLLSCRNAALLTTLGVVLVALCPLGAGPFTATHGPVTALRAVVYAVLLLITICFLPTALISCRESYIRPGSSVIYAGVCDSTPILALRC